MAIKPIKSNFDGIEWDSKTEAQWAVVLKALGINYDPHPGGWVINGMSYQPDFGIVGNQCFIEVKGLDPAKNEKRKCKELAIESNSEVFLVADMPTKYGNAWLFTPEGEAIERTHLDIFTGKEGPKVGDPTPELIYPVIQAFNFARGFRFEAPSEIPEWIADRFRIQQSIVEEIRRTNSDILEMCEEAEEELKHKRFLIKRNDEILSAQQQMITANQELLVKVGLIRSISPFGQAVIDCLGNNRSPALEAVLGSLQRAGMKPEDALQ